MITTINTRPASGQVYRFTRKNNDTNCNETVYHGRTVINEKGGTNAKDGLRIILSGAANMQVRKGNINQIYNNSSDLVTGTGQICIRKRK